MSSDFSKVENLAKRQQQSREKHAKLLGQLESAESALGAAKSKALSDFGTDDVESLRAIYSEERESVRRGVAEFEMDLSEAERVLARVEARLGV